MRRAEVERRSEEQRARQLLLQAFQPIGLEARSINALFARGIDTQERLLSMSTGSILRVPGIGIVALDKITAYRRSVSAAERDKEKAAMRAENAKSETKAGSGEVSGDGGQEASEASDR